MSTSQKMSKQLPRLPDPAPKSSGWLSVRVQVAAPNLALRRRAAYWQGGPSRRCAGTRARVTLEARMSQDHERRATAARRIPLETLVEICSSGTDDRPFEAESVDVSRRGMRMRTAYLPAVDAPLACRFSDRGRTVVVEGVVAWRNEHARGGEFGVKFTALDAGGAEVLRELCGIGATAAPASARDGAPDPLVAGSRVRLHLDGLGEPMKARVRDAGPRKVQVASNLAFLRLGRRMNVEDLDHSLRHAGSIESVSVVVEPQSGVPQLVVSLRFDESEDTPQPSVVDLVHGPDGRACPAGSARESTGSGESRSKGRTVASSQSGRPTDVRSEARSAPVADRDGAPSSLDLPVVEDSERTKTWGRRQAPETELAEEASRLRSRFENQAVMMSARAAAAARFAQGMLSRYSASAATRTAGWLRGAGKIARDLRQRASAKPVRRTAPPPRGALSVEGHRLRPQANATPGSPRARVDALSGSPSSARTRHRAIGVGIASTLVVGALVVWASGGGSAATSAGKGDARLPAPLAGPTLAAGAATPQPSAASASPAAVPSVPTPPQTAVAVAKPPAAPRTKQGIVAEVPMFGRTVMATMEPVVVPSSETPPVVAANEEAAERAAAEASANETWAQQEAEVRPEDVKPWGRGRLNLPTIHRVKLNRPGAGLRGASQATGFSVVVPKRRVTEAVAGIAKRDRRIAGVKVDHSDAGARITFRFRDKAPPFRVRLRGEYVEFLISAAE